MANLRIDIPGAGSINVPEWATEDSMQQLLLYLKTNNSAVLGQTQRFTRQTGQNTQAQQQTDKSLRNFTSTFLEQNRSTSNFVNKASDIQQQISAGFATGGKLGGIFSGLAVAASGINTYTEKLADPLMTLSNIGVGLNANLREVSAGALLSGQTLNDFSNGLLGAGTGLQVFQDASDDAGVAADAYGKLIMEINNTTRAFGYFGLTQQQINSITNEQLELARLEGLTQGDNTERILQERITEIMQVTSNLARQTNRDREQLIQAVTQVVKDDDLLAFLKAQGDPELLSKIQDNLTVLSAGLGPETGAAIAGVLTKSISTGIPLEGVSPMIAELASITGGQSSEILRELQQAIQGNDKERVAELSNQFGQSLKAANQDNQQVISILANQGNEGAALLQRIVNEFQTLQPELINTAAERRDVLDKTVTVLDRLRKDLASLGDNALLGLLAGTLSTVEDIDNFLGEPLGILGKSLGRSAIEGFREEIANLIRGEEFNLRNYETFFKNDSSRTGPAGQGYQNPKERIDRVTKSQQPETADQMIDRIVKVNDQGTQNMLQELKKSMDTGFKNLKEYINAM